MDPYSRTRFVLGEDAMKKLRDARVAVFGLGGVGGYVVEALARSGIGHLELIDHDTISPTNLNRQILATRDTVGMDKAEAAAQRVAAIDPDIEVTARKIFYLPETAKEFDIPVLDLYHTLGIDPHNDEQRLALTVDGLHFNDAGHEIIAARLKEFLEAL